MDKLDIDLLSGNGIYTLLLKLEVSKYITVGSLGKLTFPAGYYSYTGSARGTAGFSRAIRHLNVARGSNPTRRWHIDYLLPYTRPMGLVLTYTSLNLECSISRTIGLHTETISGFGCSDCRCNGHLHMEKDIDKLITAVIDSHHQVMGKTPTYITIN